MSFRDAPFPPLRAVGTDVVDPADPRCVGKASDTRFLDRVLTDAERRRVEAAALDGGSASAADIVLWRIWALKEAAFKAVTGVLGAPPVFEHPAFAVRFLGGPESGAESRAGETDGGSDGGPLEAVVRWRDRTVRGRIVETGERGPVHAVTWRGWSPDHLRWGRALLADGAGVPVDRFTERERRAVHSPPSAWVRLHARCDLAEWVGVPEEELEIVCAEGPVGRMPPRVLHRGEPAPWSVALSHHGRWLAWILGGHDGP